MWFLYGQGCRRGHMQQENIEMTGVFCVGVLCGFVGVVRGHRDDSRVLCGFVGVLIKPSWW